MSTVSGKGTDGEEETIIPEVSTDGSRSHEDQRAGRATWTRIPTTHHIILAAPDGSEHSETEIRLVSLDKDVLTYLATLAHLGAWFFFRPRHSGRN